MSLPANPAPAFTALCPSESDPSVTLGHVGAGPSPWADNVTERLIAIWRDYSAGQISEILGAEFGVSLTRNAVIGKATRLGISGDSKSDRHTMKKRKEKKEHRTTLRIVAANGNSNHLRVVRSVTSDLPKLRCIAEPALNLTLLELRDDQCHHIAGLDHLYCGHPVRPGISYCLAHNQLMHEAPKPIKRVTYTTWGGMR